MPRSMLYDWHRAVEADQLLIVIAAVASFERKRRTRIGTSTRRLMATWEEKVERRERQNKEEESQREGKLYISGSEMIF